MILPSKGIPPRQSLVSVGGEVLRVLTEAKTMSRLWDDFQKRSERGSEVTFDWFVLGLDLLFIMGAVEFESGRVRRAVARDREVAS